MDKWLSILQEFQVVEPAPTVASTAVPLLDPTPKVILFDVYGTLVCPLAGDLTDQARLASNVDSFVATAERFGFSQEIGIKWHGWFFETIASEHRELEAKGITPAEVQVDHIWAEMITRVGGDLAVTQPRIVAAYREMLANPVRAFSGVTDALRELRKGGMRLGIVSNSQFYTMPILGATLALDPEEFFEPALTFLSFRLGFSKPSPYFFRLVRTTILHFNLKPEEVLVIGNDYENDILPAQAHGLQAVLFYGSEQSVRLGSSEPTDAVITHYESLVAACGL